jgi:hypothetical protein
MLLPQQVRCDNTPRHFIEFTTLFAEDAGWFQAKVVVGGILVSRLTNVNLDPEASHFEDDFCLKEWIVRQLFPERAEQAAPPPPAEIISRLAEDEANGVGYAPIEGGAR